MRLISKHKSVGLAALLLGLSSITATATPIFVVNSGGGTVGEYTTSGATVNAALISGLIVPEGIALSGSNIFVTNFLAGTVGEYTTSGARVNAALISGVE